MRRVLLPLGFLAAAAAIALIAAHAPPEFAADRAQPQLTITYWHQTGALAALALLAAIALASVAYATLLERPVRVALYCAISCACALAVPAIFSSDVYAYAAYGAMAAHGINPYAHAALAAGDPLLDAAQWQWGNPVPVCVYGVLFVAFARLAVFAQSLGTAAPLWVLRVAACLALVASSPLIGRGFVWLPARERARAAALYALNPAAIWACAEGHNDALALLVVFAGIALMRARSFGGGFVAGLAAAVKAPALAASFVAWRTGEPVRWRMRALAGVCCGALVSVALSWPLLNAALHDVAPHGKFSPHFSPMFVFAQVMPSGAAAGVTVMCALLIAFAGRLRFAPVVLALWLCVPNPYPWYGLWLLAAAAAMRRGPGQRALIAAAMLAALRYEGEASGLLAPALECAIVAIAYGVPVIVLYAHRGRAHRDRPESHTAGLDPAPLHLR